MSESFPLIPGQRLAHGHRSHIHMYIEHDAKTLEMLICELIFICLIMGSYHIDVTFVYPCHSPTNWQKEVYHSVDFAKGGMW